MRARFQSANDSDVEARMDSMRAADPLYTLRLFHYLSLIAIVATVYFATARLGLVLAFSIKQVSAVWPPAGIALVAILVWGNRAWPGIFLAALLVNAMANEPLAVALCIATGNTAAGLLGARILRICHFDGRLERTQDVVALLAVAATSALVSATAGTAALAAGKVIHWSDGWSAWRVWWTGDSLGIMIVAPVLLTWIHRPRVLWKSARAAEYLAYLGVTVLIGLTVFVWPTGDSPFFYPRAYVAFPLLAWAGLRLGSREAALGVAIVSGLAIWGSVHGHGPFSRGALEAQWALLDAFVATVGCTALLVAAVIAERQGAREAARGSEGLLQSIIAHTPAIIYVKDLQGRYLMVNRRYEELWKMSNLVVKGKTDYDVFPQQEAEHFRAMDERVVRLGHALTEEEVAVRSDGPHTYVSVKFPLSNDEGRTCAVVGISTDITELQQAQARLREAHAQLEKRVQERTAELAAAVEELHQRNREKETLLREIHHRVKNNLQVVCSLLNLQAHGQEDSRLVAFAADCRARVLSMALVHEHLYRSNNLQSAPMALYVGALVKEIVCTQAVSARITCDVNIDSLDLPIDQAIPCGLIVNELLTNALKHAFPGERPGRVAISIAAPGKNRIDLTVTDNGIGLPAGVPCARTPGFGLSLVAMLADQLHATLNIEPRFPGTRVQLSFSTWSSSSSDST